MAAAVRDFSDIPLLFVVDEGEKKVPGQRKTTPEKLDKIIQFVWDYQDKHNGITPTLENIGRHVGISGQGTGYFVNILIDDGRLNKISGRPFRATIVEDHPKNRSAIMRFKRIREKIEQAEEAERNRIREEQAQLVRADQREADKQALFSAVEPAQVRDEVTAEVKTMERPAIATAWEEQTDTRQRPLSPEAQTVQRYSDAETRRREVTREVKQMMPKLLKVADERDLVYELVTRGYTVSRQR